MRLLLLCFFASYVCLSAADWPHFRGPTSDNVSPEENWTHQWPAEGPIKLWSAKVGTGFSSSAVSGGKLYTQGNEKDQDSVICLNAISGEPIWRHTFASKLDPKYYDGGPSSTPTVHNGAVYTLSKSGQIFCLDAMTGAVRWEHKVTNDGLKPPSWGFASSAVMVNDLVLFNVGKAGLALKQTDGSVAWNSGAGLCGYASPVLFTRGGKPLAAMFGTDTLRAVDVSSGAIQWELPWKTNFGENSPSPLITADTLLVSTGHGLGSSLFRLGDNGGPELIWNNTILGNHLNTSVLYQGHYYGFDGRVNKDGGHFGCLDATTGKEVWSTPVRGSLILAGKRLVIITLTGELIIATATPDAYHELARAQVLGGTCWTAPTLSDGRLYLRSAKGDLVCLDVNEHASNK
jgi:outer membrane protein assembly factor BamB